MESVEVRSDLRRLARSPLAPVAFWGVVGTIAILLLHRDYGVSWDEAIQATYGRLSLDYFLSGMREMPDFPLDSRLYGPAFEMISAALSPPAGPNYEIRHLIDAFAGLLAGLGLARLGWAGGGILVAWIAPPLLALQPVFFGHSFVNSKDVPFACGVVWLMVATHSALAARAFCPRRAAALGAALGLCGALRPAGLPLGAALAGAAALWVVAARASGGDRPDAKTALRVGIKLACAGAAAWLAMVAFWPWAHENPLLNPLRAMREAQSFEWGFPVLFEGESRFSPDLPRRYLATQFVVSTPIAILLLALLGVADAISGAVARDDSPRGVLGVVLLVWLLAPNLYVAVFHPPLYDGVRHFLFVLPAIALLAARGVERVAATGRTPVARRTRAAIALAAAAFPAYDLATLHPYQATYYNALVGGVRGASGRYETDYWATSYREAALWLNARAAERPAGSPPLVVLVAANRLSAPCLAYHLDPAIRWEARLTKVAPPALPEPFDYYVATTRFDQDRNFPESPEVHRVERRGAVFARIKARAPLD